MREAEEVREWLKKADGDFSGALHLQRQRKKPLPDLVCFHYPGEESTVDEAREAIKAAKMIVKFMRDRFPIELLSESES